MTIQLENNGSVVATLDTNFDFSRVSHIIVDNTIYSYNSARSMNQLAIVFCHSSESKVVRVGSLKDLSDLSSLREETL